MVQGEPGTVSWVANVHQWVHQCTVHGEGKLAHVGDPTDLFTYNYLMLRIPMMSCELWWISDSRSGGHEPGAKGESGVQVVVQVGVLKVTAKEGEREMLGKCQWFVT